MDLWRYQLEIVTAAIVLVSGVVVTLILDYLLNHNIIVREDRQARRRGR